VSRDVPDYALVMGVPARQVGFMCYCGVRLSAGEHVECEACHRSYLIEDGVCWPETQAKAVAAE
jgi:UDP-2-acetamido-3-amino-2,3-dideoxy-glucuronate N-acetyltransferase